MKIKKNICFILLSLYVISIIIVDYSIFYKTFIILCLGCSVLFYGKKILKNNHVFFMYSILTFYFLVHTMLGISVNTQLSKQYLFTMILNLICCLSPVVIFSEYNNLEKMMRIIIWTSLSLCIYICLKDFNNLFSGHLGENITKPFMPGVIYSHNDVSMYAALSAMFISYFKLIKKTNKLDNILLAVFFIFVILTGARKSLIFIVFGTVIFPYLYSYKDQNYVKKLGKIILCMALLLLFIIAIMKNDMLYKLIGYRFEGYFNGVKTGKYTESSARTRNVMKTTAINLIKNKPLLGYGLNTFRSFEGSYGTWSHNNYLELMVSGGICPLIIYYTLLVYLYYKLCILERKPLTGMFKTLLLFMLIHDYLSVSYIGRFSLLVFCLVDGYILREKFNQKERI